MAGPRIPFHQPGQRIGNLELTRLMGEGAFAEVWSATHHGALGFVRRVAVKVLKPSRDADPRHLDDLLAEARVCAQLKHPNIVQVHSVAQEGATVVVEMELVTGGTVLDLIRRLHDRDLRVPRSAVLDIGIQVCAGLSHAWSGLREDGQPFRIIHRDLKPANLLITEHGEIRIADFGLAKRLGDPTQTAAGTLKGTPCYVPPEALQNDRAFNPAMDLFAVGCILFELWTGKVLYAADSLPAIVTKIVMGDARQDAAPLRLDFPELADLVVDLLERDPKRRSGDLDAVAAKLTALRRQVPDDPGLATLLRLSRLVADGKNDALGSPPSSDSDWIRLWRRIDRTGVDSETELAPAPLLGSGVVQQPPSPAPRPNVDLGGTTKISGGAPARPQEPEPRRRRLAQPPAVVAAVGLLLLLLGSIVALLVIPKKDAGLSETPPTSSGLEDLRFESAVTPALSEPVTLARAPDPTPTAVSRLAVRDSERSTPSRLPESTPEVAPEPTPRAVPESTPQDVSEPTPQVESEPTPAMNPDACLLLGSSPPGARVWLDGLQTVDAADRRGRPHTVRPGRLLVGMGALSQPTALKTVQATAGNTLRVVCEIGAAPQCTVEKLDGFRCR